MTPKEDQKQTLIDIMQDDERLGLYEETLEEAKNTAWNIYEHIEGHLYSTSFKNGFEAGAKWQAERMYSEEEVILIIEKFRDLKMIAFSEWFEQFKKK